jgi:multidrug efflux pump subunit AcrB
MLQALAIAIVSGLIVQIPLVLIVLPGLLQLFNREIQRIETKNINTSPF